MASTLTTSDGLCNGGNVNLRVDVVQWQSIRPPQKKFSFSQTYYTVTNCYFGEYVEVGVIHVPGESTEFTTSTY